MNHLPKMIQQQIGNVTLGDNSIAYIGTFNGRTSEESNCLQALSFKEMHDRSHSIPTASPGTCKWLSRDKTFMEWNRNRSGLLWIQGSPGVGKSVLMKHAWSTLSMSASTEKTRVMTKVFAHGQGTELQRSSIGVYRCLLHQILLQVPTFKAELETDFQIRCNNRGAHGSHWEWHEAELKVFLEDYLHRSSQKFETYVFVDGIDECSDATTRDLLDLFQRLITTSRKRKHCLLKIFVSLRYRPSRYSGGFVVLVDGRNEKDIRRYLGQKLVHIKYKKRISRRLISEIRLCAGGSFRWVSLVIPSIVRALEMVRSLRLVRKRTGEVHRKLHEVIWRTVQLLLKNESVNHRDFVRLHDILQWKALVLGAIHLRRISPTTA